MSGPLRKGLPFISALLVLVVHLPMTMAQLYQRRGSLPLHHTLDLMCKVATQIEIFDADRIVKKGQPLVERASAFYEWLLPQNCSLIILVSWKLQNYVLAILLTFDPSVCSSFFFQTLQQSWILCLSENLLKDDHCSLS